MKAKIQDVVVIGCGPAGSAAAIQLFRSGINPVVFEREEVGGLLRNANLVENYPGFPGGIKGFELARLIERQLELTGVVVRFEEVLSLKHDNRLFLTETAFGVTRTKFAIVASGTKPKILTNVAVEEGAKKYLFSEVYHLLGISGKSIVIIGAGDAAFDYALNLSKKNEVIILNRSDKTKCLPLLIKRCAKVDSIKYLENHTIKSVDREGRGVSISALDTILEEDVLFQADFLITAIGREPKVDFLANGLIKKIDSLKKDGGLFMIGDVINSPHRQVTISVGDGVRTAMEIYKKTVNRSTDKTRSY